MLVTFVADFRGLWAARLWDGLWDSLVTSVSSAPLVTDAAGKVNLAYAGSVLLPGRDVVQAAARIGAVDVFSNAVVLQWHNGTNQAPLVSAGPAVSVVFPGSGALNGSVSDDGLPSNALTVSWTMVSGPGTVTFDNAGQAVTGAVFRAPGAYVLRLTANDGVLSASVTVNVTVNASATWNSGWLEAPLDGSSVSGLVPVRLVSGITLTNGCYGDQQCGERDGADRIVRYDAAR